MGCNISKKVTITKNDLTQTNRSQSYKTPTPSIIRPPSIIRKAISDSS